MDSNCPTLEHLSRDECMRLLASVSSGRIAYTRQALPAVELVNFAVQDGDIIIRTDASSKLAAATSGAIVAFEADSVDPVGHTGWSVTAVGESRAVTDREEIIRLEKIALHPWAPGKRDHFIRIPPTILNGRRLSATLAVEVRDAHRH
jgi:nitroimidazol reductase NimA-like FMN-containing flavoprotein (pyridoxamine 5'-phosphate oxidase superfamily)